MSTPTLSYVLLTHNQKETVAEAVRSALSQDVAPMEIVITDDGSTDGTFEAVEAAVKGYRGPHRLILNRNPVNLGLAGNLAKAHEVASGEVIIAAAGDDLSHPDRSRRIQETFIEKQPLLVCSYAKVIGPDGQPIPGDFRSALFYRDWALERAARSKSLYIGATGAWHRDLYDRFGPLDPECYEDLVLGFRAALSGRVAVIREELVDYRLGTGITSSDRFHASLAEFAKRREKGFVAQQAIMRQRIRDATQFGLGPGAPVFRVLAREQVKAALGLSYYRDRRGAFQRLALTHPLLALAAMRSERRRLNKMKHLLKKDSTGADG